jgi:hypothetical protein
MIYTIYYVFIAIIYINIHNCNLYLNVNFIYFSYITGIKYIISYILYFNCLKIITNYACNNYNIGEIYVVYM